MGGGGGGGERAEKHGGSLDSRKVLEGGRLQSPPNLLCAHHSAPAPLKRSPSAKVDHSIGGQSQALR